MTAERREVRATSHVFEDLDRQLGLDRGPHGEPSRTDFQTFELLEISDTFANRFDELPQLIPGRPDYRVLIATGKLVRAYTVIAPLAPDGAVELVALDIDASAW